MEILTITFMASALYTILCSKKSSKTKNVRFSDWQDFDSKMKSSESDNSHDILGRSGRSNKNDGCTSCKVSSFKSSNKHGNTDSLIHSKRSDKKHDSSTSNKVCSFKGSNKHDNTDSLIHSKRSDKKHDSCIGSKVLSDKTNKYHDSRTSGKVISGKSLKEPVFLSSNNNCVFVKTKTNCFKTDRLDGICNKKVKRKCFDDCKFPTSCSSDSNSCSSDISCSSSSSCSSSDSVCSDKVQTNTSCYEKIMCKENDLICKEVKKEFAITENNLLVMMNNYICNVENIIMTNVSTILDNPEKYVPATTGEAELEALITEISTDGNGISQQAADALRNARTTALANITNCLRKLMVCEKEQLRRIIGCLSIRDLQTNIVNFQITSAINNIIINVRKCITKELNAMNAKQREILIAESKKGNWQNLNTYLAELDTIKNTMQTELIASINTMATDAVTVNAAITAEIQALTVATQAEVEAMLQQFVDSIIALLFVTPSPTPPPPGPIVAPGGNNQAPAISPYVPKPSDFKPSKPTNPDQSKPGPSNPVPSAPDLNDLDSFDEENQ